MQPVVFVIEALTIGGAEQMLVAMANLFHRRGRSVHMVCLTHAGELADRLDEGVSLHVLDKKPGLDFSLPRKLRALIKKLDPQAVNSHLWTANTWTRLSLAGSEVRVIVTEHSRDSWKAFHYRMIDKILSFFMYKLVAVSADTADFYLTDVKVSGNKVTVINNGIDTERFRSADGSGFREELGATGQMLIGTVGRMVSAKNHPRFVEVASLLKETVPQLRVVIVGDGPERAALEQCIADQKVGDFVTLTGARTDVPEILQALDIFVLSSDREGHPLTALEAQAAGTPVVLTQAGGSADAICGNAEENALPDVRCGGFLVGKSSAELYAAVNKLANDDELRAAMSTYAIEQAESQFDEQAMVDHYQSLFDA